MQRGSLLLISFSCAGLCDEMVNRSYFTLNEIY